MYDLTTTPLMVRLVCFFMLLLQLRERVSPRVLQGAGLPPQPTLCMGWESVLSQTIHTAHEAQAAQVAFG